MSFYLAEFIQLTAVLYLLNLPDFYESSTNVLVVFTFSSSENIDRILNRLELIIYQDQFSNNTLINFFAHSRV